MTPEGKIYIAGHTGLAGSALYRYFSNKGYKNILTKNSKDFDLRKQADVEAFFIKEKPEYVFLAAAKVGGIHANNTYRAEFLHDNLMIEANIIHSAYKAGVKKLLFLGSSCIYPKLCPQPIKEEYLLTGPLEATNEPYAIAKIAGIKLCETYRTQYGCNFVSVMPTNLYGPNDNYDLNNAHVLPALIRKFYEAKKNNQPSVTIWGTGTPKREFLHVDDLAQACDIVMNKYEDLMPLNIGTGIDITISNLAFLIKKISGYEGEIEFDTSKPDGTPQKLLDISRLKALGFTPEISLEAGLKAVYQDYIDKV